MIKIEIKPSQVAIDSRSGISKKSGNPYTLNEQTDLVNYLLKLP